MGKIVGVWSLANYTHSWSRRTGFNCDNDQRVDEDYCNPSGPATTNRGHARYAPSYSTVV